MLAKTAHFVLQAASAKAVASELTTAVAPDRIESVDNIRPRMEKKPLGLVLVVPKRHAKRAATRNLIKRQMREAIRRRRADWPSGHLLIRQRSAFEQRRFPSAASDALRRAVRCELDRLFDLAALSR
jgi:ribonuclease P protein component